MPQMKGFLSTLLTSMVSRDSLGASLPSAFFLATTTSTGGKPHASGESRTPSSSSAPTVMPTRPGAHMPVQAISCTHQPPPDR